jgi:DNA polymerase-4
LKIRKLFFYMLPFNPSPSRIMHIDLNSCFATIEQQANPLLRGKPVAVAAYTTPSGCIIAPSVEAKRLGIKVGTRVKDGKKLCPHLVVLSPDPWKYRNVHLALRRIISSYSNDFCAKSIDEFVVDFGQNGILRALGKSEGRKYQKVGKSNPSGFLRFRSSEFSEFSVSPMHRVALEIKKRIKSEVGEWLRVSVGIAPNKYLAKVASSLHKPDGLDEINKDNFFDCYLGLRLIDLPWIKARNALRLNSVGIFSVQDFYNASYQQLKGAFGSALAHYWFLRLRGWEADSIEPSRRSYGNSYALPKPLVGLDKLSPILSKLVEKTSFRLRSAGLVARGVGVMVSYRNGGFWHKTQRLSKEVFLSLDIYKEALRILSLSPLGLPVRELAVCCFALRKAGYMQLDIFEDLEKKRHLSEAVDRLNNRFGNFVVTPARMALCDSGAVPDRIAFGQPAESTPQALLSGGVKELEEFAFNDANRC